MGVRTASVEEDTRASRTDIEHLADQLKQLDTFSKESVDKIRDWVSQRSMSLLTC